MLQLLADESLHGEVVRQVRHKLPHADFVTATEVHLLGRADPFVLEWAAEHGRIVVASDERTMIGFAYARVEAGLPMPGLIIAGQELGIGLIVRDLLYLIECSETEEWEGRVIHLPL